MNIPPPLLPSFWFNPTPPPFVPMFDYSLLGLFGLMLVAGIALRIVAMKQGWEKMTRRLFVRTAGMLMTLGAFGLMLYALSLERVPVLSARLGFLIWAGLFIWYAWKTYHFIRVEIPATKKRREEREQAEKWLPKTGK
jgi:hypothetical protein